MSKFKNKINMSRKQLEWLSKCDKPHSSYEQLSCTVTSHNENSLAVIIASKTVKISLCEKTWQRFKAITESVITDFDVMYPFLTKEIRNKKPVSNEIAMRHILMACASRYYRSETNDACRLCKLLYNTKDHLKLFQIADSIRCCNTHSATCIRQNSSESLTYARGALDRFQENDIACLLMGATGKYLGLSLNEIIKNDLDNMVAMIANDKCYFLTSEILLNKHVSVQRAVC